MSHVANSHRIAWIDAQIRAGRHPNATTIARRFEISRRQAARDIEYLRYSMGAPISYSDERNGYRYTDETYVLPTLIVSDPERSALVSLAERHGSIEGEAGARVAAVLRRLATQAAVVDDESAPDLPSDARELDAVTVLRRAVEGRRKVAVRYRGPDGIVVTRTIWPYAVITRFGTLSCVGYCEELGLTHVFPVFRFERIELTASPFELPAYVRPDEWTRDTVPAQPFVAIVRLHDPADAERLETAVALDDGTYRIDFHDGTSMVSALLSCRSTFKVVSPRWLRARVVQRLQAILDHHSPSRKPRPPADASRRCGGGGRTDRAAGPVRGRDVR